MPDMQSLTRELVNELLTPEEYRDWLTWLAQRPRKRRTYDASRIHASQEVAVAFRGLMERGVDPAAPAAQKLVRQSNRNWLRFSLRERLIEYLDWNPDVARKLYALGNRALMRLATDSAGAEGDRLLDYIVAATRASKAERALESLLIEAEALMQQHVPMSAPKARALVRGLGTLCRRHGLGDPRVYARWRSTPWIVRRHDRWAEVPNARREAWGYLRDAFDMPRGH
jgi:hypothetical protein